MILYRLQRGYYGRKKGFKIGSETSAGVSGVPEKYAGKFPCPYFATALANALGMGEVQVRKDLAMVSDGDAPRSAICGRL